MDGLKWNPPKKKHHVWKLFLQEPDSSSESAAEMELLEELPPPETAQLGPDDAGAGAFSEFSGTCEAHGEGLKKDKGKDMKIGRCQVTRAPIC